MMNKIFKEEVDSMLKVYLDERIFNSSEEQLHHNLSTVYSIVHDSLT